MQTTSRGLEAPFFRFFGTPWDARSRSLSANYRMLSVVAQQEWLARMEEQAAQERVVVSGELAVRRGQVEGQWPIRMFSLVANAAGPPSARPAPPTN